MAISIKHKFTSPKSDGGDASLVRPSNWNDEHDLTLAASRLFGRAAGTAGAAQEITIEPASLEFNALELRVKPGVYVPTAGGAMTGNLDMAGHDILNINKGAADYFDGFDATRVNASQVTFSAGTIKGNGRLATLAAPITKDLAVAWVAGTGGGRDTGAELASTGVHYFAIQNTTTLATDVLISHSATAPTIPAGWALVDRIFSYWNDASGNLPDFKQVGKRVYFTAAIDWLNSYTGNITLALTGPPAAAAIPSGVRVDTLITGTCRTRSGGVTSISCYDADPITATPVGFLLYFGGGTNDFVMTGRSRSNTSRQHRLSTTVNGSGSNIDLSIQGFDDFSLTKKEKAN